MFSCASDLFRISFIPFIHSFSDFILIVLSVLRLDLNLKTNGINNKPVLLPTGRLCGTTLILKFFLVKMWSKIQSRLGGINYNLSASTSSIKCNLLKSRLRNEEKKLVDKNVDLASERQRHKLSVDINTSCPAVY